MSNIDNVSGGIHVCCCTDHNYVPYAGTMIKSLCENSSKDEIINIHVIVGNDVTDDDRKDIECIIAEYNGFTIKFYTFDEDESSFGTSIETEGTYGSVTIATYYRLFLSKILPDYVSKVIYLDCDIIVRNSLRELYSIDISTSSVAGCVDILDYQNDTFNRLKYSPDYRYINAGVLLINLDYWRHNNIIASFLDVIAEFSNRLIFHDQDVINIVCCKTKMFFPAKWNVQDTYMYENMNVRTDMKDEVLGAIKKPYIIHYTTKFKPWKKWCQHPYKNEFIFYYNKTKWRDLPLLPSPDSFLKHIARIVLQKLGKINRYKTL